MPGGLTGDAAGKAGGLSIPGLGSWGVLPKLDFGLELLYGSSDTASPDRDLSKEALPDSLTLHGSVKKTF
jgi:hypothetical protein